ncbi:hypothetical protein BJ165DRAFT_1429148 [Panaeolus papilionaceus]|nr:hypothetical protein BJ165DRAFT_1429148 [Panaeolus papilionaceus]
MSRLLQRYSTLRIPPSLGNPISIMSYPGPADYRGFGYQGTGADDSGIDRANPALGMQSYGGDDYGGAGLQARGYQDGGYQERGLGRNAFEGGYQDQRAFRRDDKHMNRTEGYRPDVGFQDRGYGSKGQTYGDYSAGPSGMDEHGYDDYQTGCSPEGCPSDPYGMPTSQQSSDKSQGQQTGSQKKPGLFQRAKNIYHDIENGGKSTSNQFKDQYP